MTGLCNFKFYFIIQGVIINYLILNLQFIAKTFTKFIPNYKKPNQIQTSVQSIPNNNYQNQNNQINVNNYISQINELKKQLEEEKRKNKILFDENNNLKNINKKLNEEITSLKQYKEQIKLLKYQINKKNIEIQNYQLNNNYKDDIGITSIKPGEVVLAISFVSMGNQDIGHYAVVCKNTDLFIRLEEKLYNEYPKFKNYETYFEVKAKRIKRFKTLDENKIKNGDIINVFIVEN